MGAYPELVDALDTAVRGDAVLDGEIVAFDSERGVTSLSRLQQRMQLRDPVRARQSQVPIHLYLFDCLFYEGVHLTMDFRWGCCDTPIPRFEIGQTRPPGTAGRLIWQPASKPSFPHPTPLYHHRNSNTES